MTESSLSHTLEAVLLAAGRPVSVAQMLELFEETQRPAPEEVEAALAELGGRCAGAPLAGVVRAAGSLRCGTPRPTAEFAALAAPAAHGPPPPAG